MELRRRVYPNQKDRGRWLRGVLAALTALTVLGGLLDKQETGGFWLQKQADSKKWQLDEAFDETPAEAIIELPQRYWYALQVGAFEKEETAKQSSAAFQRRGAAGYLWRDGRYRVLASVYPQKEDAQLVRAQIQDQHGIDSYIYEITLPPLKLRMKGMQGQLDIFQAAFAHADDLAQQVQLLSVQIDRQEISAADAQEALGALNEQMEIIGLRLRQRFASPQNATVQRLIVCFENFHQFVSGLSQDESAISMGMKLKYQVFEILSDIQEVYDTLEHT